MVWPKLLTTSTRLFWILAVGWIVGLSLATACQNQTPPATPASQPDSRYFAETGFTVEGDFLRFFQIYGGTASLGYPISAEMVEGGWRVQYFEKGRLEYHPENEARYRVTVGWLGDLLQRRQPPLPPASIPPPGAPKRRYYSETGHTLSGDFLDYFDAQGGSVRFGLPISEPFLWNGQITQDFQSARFFWAPAAATPVLLEDIGRVHLEIVRAKK